MNAAKLALVASAATLMMTAGASAQSNMNSNAGMSGNVSAATHCRDTNGQVQLKSAMSGSGSATTGSAASGSASGSMGSSGQTGSATTPGASGSAAGTGTSAATGATASTLPSC